MHRKSSKENHQYGNIMLYILRTIREMYSNQLCHYVPVVLFVWKTVLCMKEKEKTKQTLQKTLRVENRLVRHPERENNNISGQR